MGWSFGNTQYDKKYLDEVKGIKLPVAFEEVDIGLNEKSKRKAISEYDQRLVLLKDAHLSGERSYFSGRIFYNEKDKQCYQFQVVGDEEKRQLHFHDLEGLLVCLIR